MPASKHTVPNAAHDPVKGAAGTFNAARYRKLIVGVVGLVASLLAQGLIPDPYAHYVAAVLAALTAVGIYAAPNTPAPADAEAGYTPIELLVGVLVVVILVLLVVFLAHQV